MRAVVPYRPAAVPQTPLHVGEPRLQKLDAISITAIASPTGSGIR